MEKDKIGQMFLTYTQYEYLEGSDQFLGLPQPPLETPLQHGEELIGLPAPNELNIPAMPLRKAMEERSSHRRYREEDLTLHELSWLLWCTQGVKEVFPEATLRNVPSAGARHPLETYLSVHGVKGLEKGLYRYVATRHSLLEIEKDPHIGSKMTRVCLGQRFVASSAVTFIWTVDIYRNSWRYGQRGYRYIFLDAGHACQNLYLSSSPLDCGVCAIAAFHDRSLTELLGLDGIDHFPIYLATVGKI